MTVFRNLVGIAAAFLCVPSALFQSSGPQIDNGRYIRSITATPDGSNLVLGLYEPHGKNFAISLTPLSGRILWQREFEPIPTKLVMGPDGHTLALGFGGVFGDGPGVLILNSTSGKQEQALGADDKLDFEPGAMYNTWGNGIVGLAFSPDQGLLYGVSNDTLFAWDLKAQHYLWVQDIPGVFETPRDLHDILPYGHASALALSPDGKQLAAARTVLHVTSAGSTRPVHFISRGSKDIQMLSPGRPVFSSDNKVLAAGDAAPLDRQGNRSYALEYWVGSNPRGTRVPGCGGGIAWTDQPDIFGCQDTAGAHLRNIHDPTKDIGAAGPPSDLPILKVGNSLWSVAYKNGDWKDATKPLPLTLVELGTGKRLTITLPGRGK
ncbi:WD40 repeat domain-containing protein [Terriglobus sp.]|uniref:WD40 repeat domain-containing protein n=1 Tax=Terriglobus sp. TaxID=1889013 RepID=UPI003AFFCDE5